jgi:hypothetical protein
LEIKLENRFRDPHIYSPATTNKFFDFLPGLLANIKMAQRLNRRSQSPNSEEVF